MDKQEAKHDYNLEAEKRICVICDEAKPGERIVQDKSDGKYFHPQCLLQEVEDDFDRIGGKPY